MVNKKLYIFLFIAFIGFYFREFLYIGKNEKLKNEYLEQHLIDLNSKLDKLKKDIDNMKNDVRKNSKFNQDLKDSLTPPNLDNINFENSIIKTMNEVLFLKRLLNLRNPYYTEKTRLKLLYKATEDGDNLTTIYEKVKNNSPVMILIHTVNNKRFGIYTEVKFGIKNPDAYNKIKDPNAFFFDLQHRIKFKTEKESTDVFYDENYIDFDKFSSYDFDLRIMNHFYKEGCFESDSKEAFKPTLNRLSGQEQFRVFEIEVYHVNRNFK